jgi:ankyrin repeat protein
MGPLYAAIDMHRLAIGHGRPNPVQTGAMTSFDMVRVLLEHGADPNAQLRGRTIQRQHTAADSTLGEGATPLLRAVKSGAIEVAEILVAYGADPWVAMPDGSTALMYAAGLGWRNGSPAAPSYDQGTDEDAVRTIDLLLRIGLDLDAVNEAGNTALHVSVSGRASEAIVARLVHAGAHPEAPNGRNQTPLDLARSRANAALVDLLDQADR